MQHVTLRVKDLDKSIAFYEKYLGLSIMGDLRSHGAPIVFLAKDPAETKLELIGDPDHAYTGSGISIGYHFDDVEATLAYFTSEGLKCSPIIRPNPVTKFFFVTDPDGMQVQII